MLLLYMIIVIIMMCGLVWGSENLIAQIGYSMDKPEYKSRNTVTMLR